METRRYVRRERCSILTKPTALHNAEPKLCSWNCPPTTPALCGDGRLRWEISHNGIHRSYRYGGLLRSVSVLYGEVAKLTMRTCKKRSRGNHTFCTAQESRQFCLFHLARGHAETILVPKETPAMHAPALHFARLRYDTPLNHLYRPSALLKIATPRTSPFQTAQDRP